MRFPFYVIDKKLTFATPRVLIRIVPPVPAVPYILYIEQGETAAGASLPCSLPLTAASYSYSKAAQQSLSKCSRVAYLDVLLLMPTRTVATAPTVLVLQP
jgi:hypothetical protein